MNLYTILIDFEDRATGIGQYYANTPEEALFEFIKNSESLYKYDRDSLLKILKKRQKLTIHVTGIKGFWILDLGVDLLDNPEFSDIYGGYIVQSDQKGPERI